MVERKAGNKRDSCPKTGEIVGVGTGDEVDSGVNVSVGRGVTVGGGGEVVGTDAGRHPVIHRTSSSKVDALMSRFMGSAFHGKGG